MRRQLHGCQHLQIPQPKSLDLFVEANPLRRSVGPLAAPSQMLRKTVSNVRVDLAEGLAWIPKVKVVLPALQVPVQLLNQLRDRLVALPMIGHLVQLFPFLLQSSRRRTHIQILPPAPFQVLVVAECESQKVQTRSFFLQIHHSRFLPIDLQSQPAFEFRFNPARQTSSLIARQHHEVSSPGESHPEALSEPYLNLSAHTAPAMEPRRSPICQCAHNFGSRLEIRATQCVALRKWPRSFLYFR